MELVAPLDLDWHRPLEIVEGPSETGPRVGGRCPAISLPVLRPAARYVLTFPLVREPAIDASVFVNCDLETLVGAMNRGIVDDDRVLIYSIRQLRAAPRRRSRRRSAPTRSSWARP